MATGYHDFTAGEVLTASVVEEYLQLQSFMTFTSAANRNSALSGVLREGLITYQSDTNTFTMYDGAAWQEWHRNAARDTWVPTVTQNGSVAVTVSRATVKKEFREVRFDAYLDVTGSGTAANDVVLLLPNTAPAGLVGCLIGVGTIIDTSATTSYSGNLICISTTTAKIIPGGSASTAGYLGSVVFTAALANTDVVRYSGTYEAVA